MQVAGLTHARKKAQLANHSPRRLHPSNERNARQLDRRNRHRPPLRSRLHGPEMGRPTPVAGLGRSLLPGTQARSADQRIRWHDSLAWLYGSGFPKSHDVGKAIDKAAGAERKVIGQSATVTPRSGKSSSGFAPLRNIRWGDVHYSWEDAPSEARAYFEAQGATR